jgi:hypothetical protein
LTLKKSGRHKKRNMDYFRHKWEQRKDRKCRTGKRRCRRRTIRQEGKERRNRRWLKGDRERRKEREGWGIGVRERDGGLGGVGGGGVQLGGGRSGSWQVELGAVFDLW